jgi:hypothetical protein
LTEWLQAHGWSVVAATTAEDLLASNNRSVAADLDDALPNSLFVEDRIPRVCVRVCLRERAIAVSARFRRSRRVGPKPLRGSLGRHCLRQSHHRHREDSSASRQYEIDCETKLRRVM